MSAPTLEVRELEVSLASGATIVEPLDLALAPGEILGLVGESGSGKTTVGLALLGFTQPGVRIAGGSVRVAGEELVGRAETELRALRGRVVSYVPQDPSTSLNPALRVDRHLVELLRVHSPAREDDATVCAALESVGLPSDVDFRRRFPHQLSGGQQQRLAIAMALICRPSVAILDEPTTGLDVLTQARILAEVTRLRDETGVAIVYVSHDLAVVSGIADRIAVMYAGSIVEQGPAAEVLEQPRHPYTHGLVSSIPDHVTPRRLRGVKGIAVGVGDRPHGCSFAPRCALRTTRCELEAPPAEATSPGHLVRCFEFARTPPLRFEALPYLPQSRNGVQLLETRDLHAGHRTRNGFVTAAAGVDLSLAPGECVALVGESGSGKTTIARTVAGLHEPSGGEILLAGEPLAPRARARTREQRRRIQIVFQNPYESLNPRMTVADAIGDPMRFLGGVGKAPARARVTELLELVRLPPGVASRLPRELSGGERQRVAIARALAPEPDVLVCDEITSALDVSVQAAVLDLLLELRRELGLALLFITHDLGVVASVADRVLVLDRGRLCEVGPVASVLGAPQAPYTRELLAAAPRLPALPAA